MHLNQTQKYAYNLPYLTCHTTVPAFNSLAVTVSMTPTITHMEPKVQYLLPQVMLPLSITASLAPLVAEIVKECLPYMFMILVVRLFMGGNEQHV